MTDHVVEVVKALAPISQDECYTIVSRAWGFSKKGNRIWQYLESCTKDVHKTKSSGQTFLWNSEEEVGAIDELRLPVEGHQRHPSTVAPEELIYGLLLILKNNIEVPKEALYREVMKMLGYSRITKETMSYMQPALELLKAKGYGKEEEETISLLT